MKPAVRQILLSTSPINPSPNSLFLPAITGNWDLSNATLSSTGIIEEISTNAPHAILKLNPPWFALQNNIAYQWTVWVRPLNRRFCYLSICPNSASSRFVTVWGLDGQGLLDTKQIGSTVTNTSFSYKRIQQGISRIQFRFTITSGASNQVPIIGAVDTFPPVYSGVFDVNYAGINGSPAIQIVANECVPI